MVRQLDKGTPGDLRIARPLAVRLYWFGYYFLLIGVPLVPIFFVSRAFRPAAFVAWFGLGAAFGSCERVTRIAWGLVWGAAPYVAQWAFDIRTTWWVAPEILIGLPCIWSAWRDAGTRAIFATVRSSPGADPGRN